MTIAPSWICQFQCLQQCIYLNNNHNYYNNPNNCNQKREVFASLRWQALFLLMKLEPISTPPQVWCSTAEPRLIYFMRENCIYLHTPYDISIANNTNNYNKKENHNNHNNHNNKYISHRHTNTVGSIPDRYQLHHAHQGLFYQLERVKPLKFDQLRGS